MLIYLCLAHDMATRSCGAYLIRELAQATYLGALICTHTHTQPPCRGDARELLRCISPATQRDSARHICMHA